MELQGTEDLQKKVNGASPAELVIILYDGALRFLENCKVAWSDNDGESAIENLSRAESIIQELQKSLKAEDNEAIVSLAGVYTKILEYLAQAKESQNDEYVDFVIKMLAELKETWVKINKS